MVVLAKEGKGFGKTTADEGWKPKVERRGNQSRRIGTGREVGTETMVDEIGHTLGRRLLGVVALYPTEVFKTFLKVHEAKGIVRTEIRLVPERKDFGSKE